MATDMHRGPWEAEAEVPDLAEFARARGVKYFMISYTDLFGGQRAKLVPAQAIADMAVEGAGFAGFATWLDLTPAHADLMAIPDPTSVIQLPWKPEVAWVAAHATRRACASRPGWSPSSSFSPPTAPPPRTPTTPRKNPATTSRPSCAATT
jgi:hypothetical protein